MFGVEILLQGRAGIGEREGGRRGGARKRKIKGAKAENDRGKNRGGGEKKQRKRTKTQRKGMERKEKTTRWWEWGVKEADEREGWPCGAGAGERRGV